MFQTKKKEEKNFCINFVSDFVSILFIDYVSKEMHFYHFSKICFKNRKLTKSSIINKVLMPLRNIKVAFKLNRAMQIQKKSCKNWMQILLCQPIILGLAFFKLFLLLVSFQMNYKS